MAVANFTFHRFGMMLCLVWNRKGVTLVGWRFHPVLFAITATNGVAHSCEPSKASLMKGVAVRNLSVVCKCMIGTQIQTTKGMVADRLISIPSIGTCGCIAGQIIHAVKGRPSVSGGLISLRLQALDVSLVQPFVFANLCLVCA